MPTYDYVCLVCTNEFEEFQKMSDPVLEECPKCKGTVRRKISGGAGLHFKGSGFYATDYKKVTGKKKTGKKVKADKKPAKGKSNT